MFDDRKKEAGFNEPFEREGGCKCCFNCLHEAKSNMESV